jgi:PAT family beta-lactamase induction signal transducer AmpG
VRKLAGLTLFLLGFSAGLPFALVGTTLTARYADQGLDLLIIGCLSWISLPYLLKVFFAPLVDRYVPFGGERRRTWIMLSQIMVFLGIVSMASFDPLHHTFVLAGLAFLVALFSSIQDIAIDAYRAELLLPSERGLGAALYVGGYRTALILSGSLSLVLATWWGWQATYFIMALLMLVGLIANLYAPAIQGRRRAPTSLYHALTAPFKELMSRPGVGLLLFFVMTYRLSEMFTSSTGTLMMPFLLQGLSFGKEVVGLTQGIGLAASLVGMFVGGACLLSVSLYRALFYFGLLQAISNLPYAWLAVSGAKLPLLFFAVIFDNFSAGLGMAAFISFLMGICDKRYTATQFALLSALGIMVGRVLLTPIAAWVQVHVGWHDFFLWNCVLSFPCLLILLLQKNTVMVPYETQ